MQRPCGDRRHGADGAVPVNDLAWWEEFGPALRAVGRWVRQHRHRLSFHASHFTILNSANGAVVVIFSHSFPLATGVEVAEPLVKLTHGQTTAGTIAVNLFFVMSVAFNRDGTRLAVGSWDKTVRLWNPETGEEVLSLR